MDNVKNTQIDIHRRFGEMSELQRNYGLRIISGHLDIISAVNGYHKFTMRKFEYYSLSYLVAGKAKFWTEKTGEISFEAPAFVIMAPNVLNKYGGDKNTQFHEDAVCFEGEVADNLLKSGVLQVGVFPTGIVRKMSRIIELFKRPSEHAQLNANIELQKLIFEIYNERVEKKIPDNPIQRVIKEINENITKWYQISELTELSGMSLSTFRRNFLKETGVLPKRYIEELKLRHAANDLITSNLKISQIANNYGYLDPYHFSRRFKAIIGTSPEKYRSDFSRSAVLH